jgi:uncharacterized protein YjbJ (UPF0337 family)
VRVCGVVVVWIKYLGIRPGTLVNTGNRRQRRKKMTHSMKDKIKGTLHEVKGTVKEKMGQVTSNPSLTAKGKSEKLAGKLQRKMGEIEKVLEK